MTSNNLPNTFVAEYTSSTQATTGCSSSFVSQHLKEANFPVSVQSECHYCGKIHGFNLGKIYTLVTERQQKEFEEWRQSKGIPNVLVPIR